MDMQCAPTGQAKSKAVLPARGGGLKHCKEACALRLLATSSFITGPAQQHVDMDWTWDARPGDGSQNSVQVAGGRYRARPVVDRVNHARPHRRTRGLRDSMVLEGKADLQLPPVLAFVLPIIFWERFDVNGMRSETITVSTCTQRPHRKW